MFPQPSDETLARIYSSTYFIGAESETGVQRAAELKRATAALYLETIKPFVSVSAPRVLEIGCGVGDFLLEAQARGFTVEGLEYSMDAVTKANSRLGANCVAAGSLETRPLPAARYDLVVGFDVIEHVRNPAQALECLHDSLKPKGVIALATPSLDSWSRRLLGRKWMEYKTEHLTYFSRKSLQRILKRTGFDDIRFLPNYKILSIDYICEHFVKYPVPVVSSILSVFRKLLPEGLIHRPVKIVASGTMVLARKK